MAGNRYELNEGKYIIEPNKREISFDADGIDIGRVVIDLIYGIKKGRQCLVRNPFLLL